MATDDRRDAESPGTHGAESSSPDAGSEGGAVDRNVDAEPAGDAEAASPTVGAPDDADLPLEWPRSFRGWLIFPALAAIRMYQLGLRPLLPATCRFYPSCSRYSVEAFRVHGVWRGFGLTLWRLVRCQPFGGCGYDPVPPPVDTESADRAGRSRA